MSAERNWGRMSETGAVQLSLGLLDFAPPFRSRRLCEELFVVIFAEKRKVDST
ncbi:MAG: hypothetical protein K0R75_2314 [Paenibacillaceae bacterium]|jgi:hypothetical protein|nr:hypothetical protein [Paenibacillaceae bacterium]